MAHIDLKRLPSNKKTESYNEGILITLPLPTD